MNYITGLGRDLGDPDFIVTIKPESRMVQDIDFQSLLDSAFKRFQRRAPDRVVQGIKIAVDQILPLFRCAR